MNTAAPKLDLRDLRRPTVFVVLAAIGEGALHSAGELELTDPAFLDLVVSLGVLTMTFGIGLALWRVRAVGPSSALVIGLIGWRCAMLVVHLVRLAVTREHGFYKQDLVWLGLAAGIGTLAWLMRVRRGQVRHALERDRVGPISRLYEQVPSGVIVIEGRAVARRPVTAPLSGRQVVGYRVEVTGYALDPKEPSRLIDGAGWDLAEVGEFLVTDDTGSAVVVPHVPPRAGVTNVVIVARGEERELEELPPGLEEALAQSPFPSAAGVAERGAWHRFRCTEVLLEDGQQVLVRAESASLSTGDPVVIKCSPPRWDRQRLVVADRPIDVLLAELDSEPLPLGWYPRPARGRPARPT